MFTKTDHQIMFSMKQEEPGDPFRWIPQNFDVISVREHFQTLSTKIVYSK